MYSDELIFKNLFKNRLKTKLKISKQKKSLIIIQYYQNFLKCKQLMDKKKLLLSKIKVNIIPKSFKIAKNSCLLDIKKITPKELLNYMQHSKIIDYLVEELNYFANTLESYPSQDTDFYINECSIFFNKLLTYQGLDNNIIRIVGTDCIMRLLKLHQLSQFLKTPILHQLYSSFVEDYINDLKSLSQKLYDIVQSNVTTNSAYTILNLPKSHLSIKKRSFSNNKNKYYSEINFSTINFNVNTINEFIDTLAYYILYADVTIKTCKHCGRWFIPSRKDAIYCKNPSPENEKRTCQEIRTHFNQTQTAQNIEIQNLYDRFQTICRNKIKKYPEYKIIWNNFMDLYKTHNEDIFYSKYTRKKMINWLNEIIKNPKLLLPKTIVDTKSISTDKDSINFKLDDNIDIMELQRQLMKQQQEDSFNSIIDYLK